MAEKPRAKPAKVVQTIAVNKVFDSDGNQVRKPSGALDHYRDGNERVRIPKNAIVVADYANVPLDNRNNDLI